MDERSREGLIRDMNTNLQSYVDQDGLALSVRVCAIACFVHVREVFIAVLHSPNAKF